MLKKNVLFTGTPGIGKTTLIEKLARRFDFNVRGFITKEILEGGRRVGFSLLTATGKEVVMAHINKPSAYKVSQYGVDLLAIDSTGVREILDGVQEGQIIVVDEIGKMELFSTNFRDAVSKALDSPCPVFATMMVTQHPFTDEIRRRHDVTIFEITTENRNILPEQVFRDFTRADSSR
jgi:nucleoside-triphosphatase THEP1